MWRRHDSEGSTSAERCLVSAGSPTPAPGVRITSGDTHARAEELERLEVLDDVQRTLRLSCQLQLQQSLDD